MAGVLPVIKPAGPTSHDVVQVARRALKQRQIGHTGTLDPAATGVLVLCMGPYTKMVPYLVESSKTYTGFIGLGLETTTDDREGAPTMVSDAGGISVDRIKQQAARLVGDIDQLPPKYAAVKIAGKKLYEYAREGEEVEIQPRPVTVYSFEVGEPEPLPAEETSAILARGEGGGGAGAGGAATASAGLFRVPFTARVSAGTYVRSMARDLGRELGCGGYLASLARTAVGQFREEGAMSLDVLERQPERYEEFVLRGAASLDAERYPVLRLIRGYTERLLRGQPLHEKMMENADEAAKVASGATVGVATDDGTCLLAMMQAERFEAQMKENIYGSRFMNHFRALRVFPGGLR